MVSIDEKGVEWGKVTYRGDARAWWRDPRLFVGAAQLGMLRPPALRPRGLGLARWSCHCCCCSETALIDRCICSVVMGGKFEGGPRICGRGVAGRRRDGMPLFLLIFKCLLSGRVICFSRFSPRLLSKYYFKVGGMSTDRRDAEYGEV